MYHWKIGVMFLDQSVSLEGWCSVSSSECITRRLFLTLVYTRKVRFQFLGKNVWKPELKVSVLACVQFLMLKCISDVLAWYLNGCMVNVHKTSISHVFNLVFFFILCENR